jgi:hypothetical protein
MSSAGIAACPYFSKKPPYKTGGTSPDNPTTVPYKRFSGSDSITILPYRLPRYCPAGMLLVFQQKVWPNCLKNMTLTNPDTARKLKTPYRSFILQMTFVWLSRFHRNNMFVSTRKPKVSFV